MIQVNLFGRGTYPIRFITMEVTLCIQDYNFQSKFPSSKWFLRNIWSGKKLSVAGFELRSNFSGPSVPKLCPASKTSSKKWKLASDSFFGFAGLPFTFDPDSNKKLFSREWNLPDTRQALTQNRVTVTRPWFRLLKADDASSHEMKKIVGWTLGGVRRVQPSIDCHPSHTQHAPTPTNTHSFSYHTQKARALDINW